MLDKLVSDDIPNIRFNVAKSYRVLINVLQKLPNDPAATILLIEKTATKNGTPPAFRGSQKGQQLIEERIAPNLERLGKDDDVDVRFFAGLAEKEARGEGAGEMMEMVP